MKLSKSFVKGKRVFLRADLNVPLRMGKIMDSTRIIAVIPTIKFILPNCKQLIIASHLGRPKGKPEKRYSLLPVKKYLEKHFEDVGFATSYSKIPNNKIVLLENLRFHDGEKKNSLSFAKKLASLAEVMVNDAFGTAHRKHASVYALAKLIPAVPGLLMDRELKNLSIKSSKKPRVAILGFAKISDKTEIIEGLLSRVEVALIGGGAVFTFLKAQGYNVGKSLYEPAMVKVAKKILRKYGPHMILAVDFETKKHEYVAFNQIKKNDVCLDIGPASTELFKGVLKKAKTVIWNGPLGVYEKGFAKGSEEISDFIAEMKAKTIIGGGDTAAMINNFGLKHKITFVSTGGGASLELLSGKKLPAVEVLKN
jgi:phosphoglycerate kinase